MPAARKNTNPGALNFRDFAQSEFNRRAPRYVNRTSIDDVAEKSEPKTKTKRKIGGKLAPPLSSLLHKHSLARGQSTLKRTALVKPPQCTTMLPSDRYGQLSHYTSFRGSFTAQVCERHPSKFQLYNMRGQLLAEVRMAHVEVDPEKKCSCMLHKTTIMICYEAKITVHGYLCPSWYDCVHSVVWLCAFVKTRNLVILQPLSPEYNLTTGSWLECV